MNLREQAALDNRAILEDETNGFGWPVTVTSPAGASADLTGMSGDIHLSMDPDTGQAVSGRIAHVTIPIAALTDAGLGIPEAIADRNSEPWVMVFTDVQGNTYTFKVSRSFPDRTLGCVLCNLERYIP